MDALLVMCEQLEHVASLRRQEVGDTHAATASSPRLAAAPNRPSSSKSAASSLDGTTITAVGNQQQGSHSDGAVFRGGVSLCGAGETALPSGMEILLGRVYFHSKDSISPVSVTTIRSDVRKLFMTIGYAERTVDIDTCAADVYVDVLMFKAITHGHLSLKQHGTNVGNMVAPTKAGELILQLAPQWDVLARKSSDDVVKAFASAVKARSDFVAAGCRFVDSAESSRSSAQFRFSPVVELVMLLSREQHGELPLNRIPALLGPSDINWRDTVNLAASTHIGFVSVSGASGVERVSLTMLGHNIATAAQALPSSSSQEAPFPVPSSLFPSLLVAVLCRLHQLAHLNSTSKSSTKEEQRRVPFQVASAEIMELCRVCAPIDNQMAPNATPYLILRNIVLLGDVALVWQCITGTGNALRLGDLGIAAAQEMLRDVPLSSPAVATQPLDARGAASFVRQLSQSRAFFVARAIAFRLDHDTKRGYSEAVFVMHAVKRAAEQVANETNNRDNNNRAAASNIDRAMTPVSAAAVGRLHTSWRNVLSSVSPALVVFGTSSNPNDFSPSVTAAAAKFVRLTREGYETVELPSRFEADEVQAFLADCLGESLVSCNNNGLAHRHGEADAVEDDEEVEEEVEKEN